MTALLISKRINQVGEFHDASFSVRQPMQRVALLCLVLAVSPMFGCGGEPVIPKSMPAPIQEQVPYTLTGEIFRVYGGDDFELGSSHNLHYILVQGVDCPKYGQAYYSKARHLTIDLTRGQQVRAEIVARDELMAEIADVYLGDPEDPTGSRELNLGLELIRRGCGWYDGNEFEDAELYRQAEQAAREARIGLWKDDDPIAPWDFEDSLLQKIQDNINSPSDSETR